MRDQELFSDVERRPAPRRSPRTRGAATRRLLEELRAMLHARVGLTIDQLAAEFGVTTRTVRRDLEVLQEVGYAIVDEMDECEEVRRWRVLGRVKEVA